MKIPGVAGNAGIAIFFAIQTDETGHEPFFINQKEADYLRVLPDVTHNLKRIGTTTMRIAVMLKK